MKLLDIVFGTYSERELKRIRPIVDKVLSLENEYSSLTEEQLRGKTTELKGRLQNGETLDDILPEAFATVREAAWRVIGLKPYEVQVIGGIILHQGRIAEMKTGEGKTLVATLPAYLNALSGKGVMVVTVNEYLAKRDSEWMGKVYTYLGLSVGLVEHSMLPFERQAAYKCDITYVTNNEVGFDYLRDNMITNKSEKVQRGFTYAIIDEVDSILIDEARTPLIISGQGDDVSELYEKADKFVRKLKGVLIKEEDKASKLETIVNGSLIEDQYADYDFTIDEKHKSAVLTDKGIEKAEKYFNVENLGDVENLELNHYISRALKAHNVFKRDIDYVVKDGEIVIVDEHTGRLMEGRRYSEGIHQAIETKEGVQVKKESKTLATISFQNLFRKFEKISGMTGTAMTEEEEFRNIYGLDVIEIPTNKPVIRVDKNDKIFINKKAKLDAIVETVKQCYEKGQPILVGTTSVEASEELSNLFKEHDIKHTVLNAKYHDKEAEIVAQAGEYKAVTIATNMAGRGTDILLGGNAEYKAKKELANIGYSHELIEEATTYTETTNQDIIDIRQKYKEVKEKFDVEIAPKAEQIRQLGGLYILGTERHSSRRIDNQLRGRAGRQGDPGVSEFVISFEDDLMRLFGANRLQGMFSNLNIPSNIPIDMKIVGSSIEKAQMRVESMHYNTRKLLLDYDMVMNLQRDIIYEQRNKVLEAESVREDFMKMMEVFITETVENNIMNKKRITLEDQDSILSAFSEVVGLDNLPNYTEDGLFDMKPSDISNKLIEEVHSKYAELESKVKPESLRAFEKRVLFFEIDSNWQDHIVMMDELKQGIGLRAIGQHDPLMVYKLEGFELFEGMMNYIRQEVLRLFLSVYKAEVLDKENK